MLLCLTPTLIELRQNETDLVFIINDTVEINEYTELQYELITCTM